MLKFFQHDVYKITATANKKIALFTKIISMKKLLYFLTFLFSFLPSFGQQDLVSQFSKTVAFLYSNEGDKLEPYGTGFLLTVPAKTRGGNYVYLVTAKHVLFSSDSIPLSAIFIRVNTKDSSCMFNIPLVWSGPQRTVFVHSDSSVDLAVLPIQASNLDFKFIPVSQIVKVSEYDSLKITVGTEVFFTGLFTAYVGTKKIDPIFRFGKVCLIPKERIKFVNADRRLILIESSSFGGNSGSPVIFKYINGNQIHVGLAGIMNGSFDQGQILAKTKDKNIIAWSNMGISAVTPAGFLLEILNIPELAKQRIY